MGLTIGVDVGGTKVLAGVVDEDGQILEQERQSTPKTDGEAIAEVIAGLVASLRSRHEVEAVGIGAAGWIDLDRANVMFAPNLVWRNEPLKLRVSKLIDLPIVVENDANCHAWAEHRFGAARGRDTVVAVILGTGIGGGIILEGRLVSRRVRHRRRARPHPRGARRSPVRLRQSRLLGAVRQRQRAGHAPRARSPARRRPACRS